LVFSGVGALGAPRYVSAGIVRASETMGQSIQQIAMRSEAGGESRDVRL
jgi:hypothetical protein